MLFGYLLHKVQVTIPLFSIRVVDIGQEVQNADGLAFALLVKDTLLEQLVDIRLNVSFLGQAGSELSDGRGSSLTVVRIGL